MKDWNKVLLEGCESMDYLLVDKAFSGFLFKKKADPNAKYGSGRSALEVATSKDALEIMRRLLDEGASTSAASGDGNGPLHIAARGGALKAVELLIERGAEIDARNAEGQTPLTLALTRGKKNVVAFLASKGAAQSEGDRALLAKEKEDSELRKLLGPSKDFPAAARRILKKAESWGRANGYPVGKMYPQYEDIRQLGLVMYRKDGMAGLQSIMKDIQSDGGDLYTYLDLLWNHLKDDEGNEIWSM